MTEYLLTIQSRGGVSERIVPYTPVTDRFLVLIGISRWLVSCFNSLVYLYPNVAFGCEIVEYLFYYYVPIESLRVKFLNSM